MAVRPKYVAARDFVHARKTYAAGDPITNAGVLAALLTFGDKFVTNTATRQADPPTTTGDEPATEGDA